VTRGRTVLGAGALAVALAAPAAAQDVGAQQLRESVETIRLDESIKTIDLDESVEDLQVERERGGNVTLTVSSDVLFEFDRARLTPVARATVERIAARISAGRGPVLVDGHTDSLGSDAYNLRLSRRRAATVSAALRAGLPGGIAIRSRGFGESRPVEPNTVGGEDNPEGRAKNRRVTIRFRRT
jgi:OmpA-OmpF porin, OOP family